MHRLPSIIADNAWDSGSQVENGRQIAHDLGPQGDFFGPVVVTGGVIGQEKAQKATSHHEHNRQHVLDENAVVLRVQCYVRQGAGVSSVRNKRLALGFFLAQISVVDVGANHQRIGNAEPHGDEDDAGQQSRPNSAGQVENVAQKPNGDKPNSNPFSRLQPPLFYEARHEQHNPARKRCRAQNAGNRAPHRADRLQNEVHT